MSFHNTSLFVSHFPPFEAELIVSMTWSTDLSFLSLSYLGLDFTFKFHIFSSRDSSLIPKYLNQNRRQFIYLWYLNNLDSSPSLYFTNISSCSLPLAKSDPASAPCDFPTWNSLPTTLYLFKAYCLLVFALVHFYFLRASSRKTIISNICLPRFSTRFPFTNCW